MDMNKDTRAEEDKGNAFDRTRMGFGPNPNGLCAFLKNKNLDAKLPNWVEERIVRVLPINPYKRIRAM